MFSLKVVSTESSVTELLKRPRKLIFSISYRISVLVFMSELLSLVYGKAALAGQR